MRQEVQEWTDMSISVARAASTSPTPTMKEHEEFERLLVILNVRRPAQELVNLIGHVGLRCLRETQGV